MPARLAGNKARHRVPVMPTFTPQALHALASLIVGRMGSSAEETEEVADHLVRANLSGHDSHGVGMLPAYVRLLQDGLLVPNQTPHTVLDAGALLVIDARRGFGQRMAADAVRRAIAPGARDSAPACWRCAMPRMSGASAPMASWPRAPAAPSPPSSTSPTAATSRRPGPAPNRVSAPTRSAPRCPAPDGPALMLDMATTTIAAGKARVAYNKGVPVPDDCLIDAEGRPTNDPTGFIRDRTGAMLPFGRHKGSGLAVMCEIMAGAIGGGQRVDEPVGAASSTRCWRR